MTISAVSAFGQSPPEPPLISVSGSAELKVKPDEARLHVGVETRHEHLNEAKRENDQRVAVALAFLKLNHVKEENIQTDFMNVRPEYDTPGGVDPNTGLPVARPDRKRSLVVPAYYLVRKNITIKLSDLKHFDAVLSGLITNGVNHVGSIEFQTSELKDLTARARAMAVRDAKQKAESLAEELGVVLGKPYKVGAHGWSGMYGGGGGGGGGFSSAAGLSEQTPATFAAGQIIISASASVSFLID